MLSKKDIQEYVTIYRNQYGKELSLADATKQANSLIRLYKTVLSPLKNEASENRKLNLKNSA